MAGSAGLPVIDVGPLTGVAPAAATAAVAEQIQVACRERGFFYVTGHGVPAGLLDELAGASAEFFALPAADKLEIAMERGGRAWRGFFPLGAELTSGQPDLKGTRAALTPDQQEILRRPWETAAKTATASTTTSESAAA